MWVPGCRSFSSSGPRLGFDRATGQLIDWLNLDVQPGSLMGIEFDDSGRLYVVNNMADAILRLEVAE